MAKSKHPLRSRVLKDSFWTLIATLISRFGGLFFTVLLARYLLPEGLGIYALALSVALIFVTIADLGINQAIIRYASLNIDKNKNKVSSYFKYLLKWKIVSSLSASVILLSSSYFFANLLFHKQELFLLLILLCFYVLFTALEGFFESVFYIKNEVRFIAFKEVILQVLRISFVFLAFTLFSRAYYVLGAIISLVLSSLIALIVVFYLFSRTFLINRSGSLNKDESSGLIKFILFYNIANITGVIFSYLDILMLGIFIPSDFIGYYRAATSIIITIAGLLSFPGVFLSTLTKIPSENLQEPFDKITKILFILTIPAIIGIILLSRYILVFIFGYDYLQATVLLSLLSPLILIFSMNSLSSIALASKNKLKELSVVSSSCLFIGLFLDYLFIKLLISKSYLYAAMGVAIATLISWLVFFIWSLFIIKKSINLKFKFKFLFKPLFSSIIMGAMVYALYSYWQSDITLLKGAIMVLFGILVYCITIIIVKGFNKEELSFFKDKLMHI